MEGLPPIGFVVLTHSSPQQVQRLIDALNKVYQDPPVALHHDFSACPAELSLPPNVRLVQPHVTTGWGTFSLVQATLAGMETLFSGPEKPRWFALLSGSCYPTKPAGQVIDDLQSRGYDAYIHHELIDPMMPKRIFHDICFWRYFGLQIPLLRRSIDGERAFRNIRSPQLFGILSPYFRRNVQCYAGSQWFTAKREVADYVLNWAKENRWLADYLRRRPAADESYFHTILANANQFRLLARNYRYIDWSQEGAQHPRELDKSDVGQIIRSGCHFARKIPPESPVLDELDEYLGICSARASTSAASFEVSLSSASEPPRQLKCVSAKISVVIPTFRRAASLQRALQSLEFQTDRNFEVIVVCDGEDAATQELSESLEVNFHIKWIFNAKNCYAAAARNRGAEAAEGWLLLFADDDATADPYWIEMHRRGHESESIDSPTVVFGKLVHIYDRLPNSHTERILRQERDERDERYRQALSNPDSFSAETFQLYPVCGFNCSIRKDVFQAHGGYDTNMRPKEEDAELGLRLHSSGIGTIVEPRALLFHHDSKDLVADARVHWKNAGRIDLYRLAVKKQRTERAAALKQLRTANPVRWVHQELSWHAPRMMNAIGELARGLCDLSGSRWAFRQWQRMSTMTEFFQPLKEDQVKLEDLRALAGTPLLVLGLANLVESCKENERSFFLSLGRFHFLMDVFKRLNYQCATADEGLSFSERHRFVLTIDYGFEDLYSTLLPLIDSYNIKPLVFLVADEIGGFNHWESDMGYRRRRLLSAEQIREMQRRGVEFGSNSCSHAWLPSLTDDDLQREIRGSKEILEDLCGVAINKFAYPYGGADARVRGAVARAGYKWAFSSRPELSFWDDATSIKRVSIVDSDSTIEMLSKILTGRTFAQRLVVATSPTPPLASVPSS